MPSPSYLVARAAVSRCRPNLDKFETAFGASGAVYVFCRETGEPAHHFYARMFAPGMGVLEDPATGSAAAAFAGLLASGLGDRTHTTVIEKGYDMDSPRLIHLGTTVAAGRLVFCHNRWRRGRRHRGKRSRHDLPSPRDIRLEIPDVCPGRGAAWSEAE
jgi:predicted PhzF superfamily epimerase YddE/YHI9